MSYHIYTTQGLVLSKTNRRESDRVYQIFTRDFGLIRASALGVRKEASKLRGALEPVSLIQVSLVRGKEYWRVTSVELVEKVDPIPEILRPLVLLQKLVQGEASNPELFDTVKAAVMGIGMIYHTAQDKEMFEINLVAQILFHLGYLKEDDLKIEKKELVRAINEGIQASHL